MGTQRVLADLDEDLVREFKKFLIDDRLNMKQWLTNQIQAYLKTKGGKKTKKSK